LHSWRITIKIEGMSEPNIVMLVDDDEVCLALGREILEGRCVLYTVPSGKQAFKILEKVTPDLILLDIEMPEMDGYAMLKKLKEDKATKDIPVIFLSARANPGDEFDGLRFGAIDFVTKPFSPLLLVQRVENHLLICSQRKELTHYNNDLKKMIEIQIEKNKNLQNAMISTFSGIVEFRDKMSDGHMGCLAKYMQKMLDALREQGLYADEVNSWDMEAFVSVAQMHDIGKI